ncbi:hypothetical protein A0H81_14263 [Grifola frondosa]|uniref:Uncharacterized protein n=1 Tax=Grifola frondosa TaxID=5627 RepID=A0A1C7LS90_GRIFR|nr:hypothetical protein A0H81_14263 [Grifola frondosa]
MEAPALVRHDVAERLTESYQKVEQGVPLAEKLIGIAWGITAMGGETGSAKNMKRGTMKPSLELDHTVR